MTDEISGDEMHVRRVMGSLDMVSVSHICLFHLALLMSEW